VSVHLPNREVRIPGYDSYGEKTSVTLFLIGAGFNVDAGRCQTPYGAECWYPLVNDVARLCFDLEPSNIPADRSIEDLFLEAHERNDRGPMKRLTDKLMEADYYLASKLASPGESSCHREFFEAFPGANILTFNYDSLPEIFLFRTGRWYPEDGYGVPVKAELSFGATLPADRKSTSLVLHLHGSFCLRASDFEMRGNPAEQIAWLVRLARPLFKFDPDCLSPVFLPYRRVLPDMSYEATEGRVIAPVPNKGPELEQAFVRELYGRACSLVRESGMLISVGYSFNSHDIASYGPILQALDESGERKLVVVSPGASKLAEKIRGEYPRLQIKPIDKTLKSWTADSFRY
jgi:hypothetical protein